MTLPPEMLPDDDLLSPAETAQLAFWVEAGVLAREARARGGWRDATDAELAELERRGTRARRQLVHSNLRLVAMVARQHALRAGLTETDLFQEGCLGLLTAIDRFDHRRGIAFTTYATYWIRASVGALSGRQLGALDLPAGRGVQLRVVRGVEGALAQRLGRLPRREELADELGRSRGWTGAVLAHARPEPLDETLADPALVVHDRHDLGPVVDLRGLLQRVPVETRAVLRLRLGFETAQPLSLAATARALGRPIRRVREQEQQGLEQLRGLCPASAREDLCA